MRWAGNVGCMEEKVIACKVLVRKLWGRIIHRWEGNIKMDRKEIGWECMDWINLAVSLRTL
jgi:hypothetical protein